MFKRILVSLYDYTASEFIVDYVHGLTRWLGCRVTLLHVLGHKPESLEASQKAFLEAQTLLERLAQGARVPPRLRLEWQGGESGESVAGIILRVSILEGADLIVMGTQTGEDPLVHKLGSVSQAVAARSTGSAATDSTLSVRAAWIRCPPEPITEYHQAEHGCVGRVRALSLLDGGGSPYPKRTLPIKR